ncbi:hypothetical protein EDB84DRAFT_179031 [Lactarius hengduanensis]|nr:hypothetical protein EDB84DRAFT_179031 [Lactarius hengduanensis]
MPESAGRERLTGDGCSVHEWLPVQHGGCRVDHPIASGSGRPSVCSPFLSFFARGGDAYCVRAVVVTIRILATQPTRPTAHTDRSNPCIGTSRMATTCSRGRTPRRSTTTCTTSATAHKTIFSSPATRRLNPAAPPPLAHPRPCLSRLLWEVLYRLRLHLLLRLRSSTTSSSSSSTTSSSSPPAPPPSSPPAPPPSSPPAPPPSSSPAPPPYSPPAPPPSSPPAGGSSTSQTSTSSTSTSHSSPHHPPPSTPTHKEHKPEHTPTPDPKHGQAHEPEHKPKHKTCKHRPKPKSSSGESQNQLSRFFLVKKKKKSHYLLRSVCAIAARAKMLRRLVTSSGTHQPAAFGAIAAATSTGATPNVEMSHIFSPFFL